MVVNRKSRKPLGPNTNLNSVFVVLSYGEVLKGFSYKVLSSFYDGYMIKCHGRPICIPSFVTGFPSDLKEQTNENEMENLEYAS